MPKRNEQVFEALIGFVKKNPDADVDAAVQAARKVDSSIDPDDKRSFNARYLLPAKRKAGVTGKKKTTPKKKARKKTARKGRAKPGAAKKTRGARELVLERDQRVLALAKGEIDPKEAYGLAADVDEFLEQLRKAL